MSATVLRAALHDTTEAKAAKRLMVALSYKDGEHVTGLSHRHDIPTSTLGHVRRSLHEIGTGMLDNRDRLPPP